MRRQTTRSKTSEAAGRHGIRRRPSDRQLGVTLIGLMIGLAVGTLILSGALSIYLMISRTAREALQQARLNQELRAALEVMQQDIQRAGYWDFADTNGDGDANGDGLFDWRDLSTDEDGEGTFDSDGDGIADARDLDPLNNPFQRRYGRIQNDLCLDTDSSTGSCSAPSCTVRNADDSCIVQVQRGRCVTFSYDLDMDARVGIRACDAADDISDCPRPAEAPFRAALGEPFAWISWYPPAAASADKDVEMEMFGYRLRRGAIQMRIGRSNRNDDSFGCDSGRWESITSPDIRITGLEFILTTRTRNANPAKEATETCASDDPCGQSRRMEIRLSGQHAKNSETRLTLGTLVGIRNDRYLIAP
ncbi:PilW family protein [Imhoffiella purpurea]|uniref:Uncharacterized protein n=1 Tax=Imhoffiella purpurea TaxID=1249627 RepID=W9VSJ3_9GAMM|nr:hypothetical protein [Imhoffiella purpurea]EXJ13325.1 hypothetical protein D779_3850 [Imhoffiella purpurea]